MYETVKKTEITSANGYRRKTNKVSSIKTKSFM